MRNDKTNEIVGFEDVKHLFRIYSYNYQYDYLNNNYGTKINIKEARNCNKTDYNVSNFIEK